MVEKDSEREYEEQDCNARCDGPSGGVEGGCDIGDVIPELKVVSRKLGTSAEFIPGRMGLSVGEPTELT